VPLASNIDQCAVSGELHCVQCPRNFACVSSARSWIRIERYQDEGMFTQEHFPEFQVTEMVPRNIEPEFRNFKRNS
jgi:hypothetical protein